MKKAKLSGDILSKASDFLSVLKNITTGKKENTDTEKPPAPPDYSTDNQKRSEKKADKPEQNQNEVMFSTKGYGASIFQKVMEEHDKKVKNIMKNQTDKDNI